MRLCWTPARHGVGAEHREPGSAAIVRRTFSTVLHTVCPHALSLGTACNQGSRAAYARFG
ncbi:hypothetical protein PJI17_13965 [Mycobacterium kansasii]